MFFRFSHQQLILCKLVKVIFNVLINFPENLVHLPLGFKMTNFTVELGFAHKKPLLVLLYLMVWAKPEVEFLSTFILGLYSFLVGGQHIFLVNSIVNTDVLRSL